MKKKTFNLILILSFILLPLTFVSAQEPTGTGLGTGDPEIIDTGISTGGNNSGDSIQLTNPLGETKDIPTLVQKILEIALKIGVPLIALAIIYTGYLFIAARGRPDKLTEAKQALVWVVVGSGILLGAYVIAEALVGTIEAIRGN